MGQTEVMVVSQLLGLEIQDLVVCLTHKETVSDPEDIISKFNVIDTVII